MSTNQKIGGEYGDVRTHIDVDKLNAYLSEWVRVISTPVKVKQFKVRCARRSLTDSVNGSSFGSLVK